MDISNIQAAESPTREFQLQTELEHPNTPLKDLGYSGVSGGSSSVLARKEVQTQNIYVPLKKRLLEKSFSSSKLPSTD